MKTYHPINFYLFICAFWASCGLRESQFHPFDYFYTSVLLMIKSILEFSYILILLFCRVMNSNSFYLTKTMKLKPNKNKNQKNKLKIRYFLFQYRKQITFK